jgi:hypothetical protein
VFPTKTPWGEPGISNHFARAWEKMSSRWWNSHHPNWSKLWSEQ